MVNFPFVMVSGVPIRKNFRVYMIFFFFQIFYVLFSISCIFCDIISIEDVLLCRI